MKNKILALVVDDNPENRDEISMYLTSMGHSYKEAASVQAAKEMLESGNFDYVVLDMCIPVETGNPYADVKFGKSLFQHILEKFDKALPILVVSGVAKGTDDVVSMMKLRSEGVMVSYVIKPFNSERNSDIIKEIEELLSEKSKLVGSAPAAKKKREKKPPPDGSDKIDLDCCETARHLMEIKVNGKPVAVGHRALNVLIRFGQAQREWDGKKNERYKASLGLADMKISTAEMVQSDLTSLFSKMKAKLEPMLKRSILDGEKDENGKRIKGRWILGATIVNLDKGEPFFEY